ncbi:hypothetical protein [Maridesulfovibrio sp.]|uniref:hypothetical protein n=1 Tax=Maridesulfovibrio sp. TaxID=2795000 RepID=UPI0029F517DC|nr:hypothetical protein [Maridesulfovibrio sp.]
MDNGSLFAVALSAAVGYLGAYVTQRHKDQSNVTNERKEWRDAIRKLALKITTITEGGAATDLDRNSIVVLMKIHTALAVRLNPIDKEDDGVLESMRNLIEYFENGESSGAVDLHNDVVWRLAQLLKHDWERVKCQSSHLSIEKMSNWIRGFFSQDKEYDRSKKDFKKKAKEYSFWGHFCLVVVFALCVSISVRFIWHYDSGLFKTIFAAIDKLFEWF